MRTAKLKSSACESKQRQGLGQLIFNTLIKAAEDQGIRRIFLDTTNQQAAAQKFYVKNGFSEFRREKLRTMTMIYYEKWMIDHLDLPQQP